MYTIKESTIDPYNPTIYMKMAPIRGSNSTRINPFMPTMGLALRTNTDA